MVAYSVLCGETSLTMPDPLQATLSARSYLSREGESRRAEDGGGGGGGGGGQRGRPRLTSSERPVQERRSQIRRAQQTYRLKKEATLQGLRLRVAELERTLGTVSGLAEDLHDVAARDESLSLGHRTLLDQIVAVTRGTDPAREMLRERERERGAVDTFGYQVSVHGQLSSSLLASTYSHHERTLARRLHRIALEQTYAWFRDRATSPAWIVHVFGLLPCLPEPQCVERTYRRVLRAGSDDSLELLVMPFYGIGGAGTHYPRRDETGCPVYPENMREPKRILDRAVGALPGRQHTSGLAEADPGNHRKLQMLGFDGDWFDCHDVQGYLESLGITLDSSTRLLRYGAEPSRLDLDRFLQELVPKTRILGRAPGFKKTDVDDALTACAVMD